MTILVVRTEPGAGAFVRRLEDQGIAALACPVTIVRPLNTPLVVPEAAQGVILTSVNAVEQYGRRGLSTDLPAFAVGSATATAAAAAGFTAVHDAGSDVRGLEALIADRCRPADGPLVYPTALDVAGTLRERLEGRGYTVVAAAIYEAASADSLPESVEKALRTRTVDGAALFSGRNAVEFVRLALAAGHDSAISGMYALCISDAVAAALQSAEDSPGWRRIVVAASPDADAMAAALGDLHRQPQ